MASRDLLSRLCIDDRDRRVEDRPCAQHGTSADASSFDHHRATPDERLVFDHHRPGVGRLEDAADADTSCQVDVGADLCAGADRGPGVDHRPLPHAGADVHVAGHEHRTGCQVRTPAGARPRDDPHARSLVAPLERNLVGELKGAQIDGLHRPDLEQEQDGVLEPLVDDDLIGRRVNVCDPLLASIQQVDRLVDEALGLFVARMDMLRVGVEVGDGF